MKLLELLDHPDREFTAIPFWFLNDALSEAELRRQLTDFAEHGIYGVVLHPRIGLPDSLEYLSENWFQMIRAAVRTAAELHMSIVLYDEGMYPSGSANGQVVDGHPEFASQGLALVQDAAMGDTVLAATEKGLLVVRKSGGTIRGIHYGEDDGEPNAPASADILNPKAVDRFIDLTHNAYYAELEQYFGNTIIGFFTDEPSILGRNVDGMMPWTEGFADVFTAAGDNIEHLSGLFTDDENKDVLLYRRLILAREKDAYYTRLSNWCEQHGIALMGHPEASDDIETERCFHVPGQDLVLRWVAPETGGICGKHSTMAKCSADAARIWGRRRNSNECFGACNRDGNPWQLSGGDIKWYLDWLAVRGVNLFIPHAFYYSIQGKRKDERPPDVGPHSIWWPHYNKWAVYMQRLSCLMTNAQLCADVAVLCKNQNLKPEVVAPLFEKQIGFQYLPESVWDSCEISDGGLLWNGRRYTAVLGSAQQFEVTNHSLAQITRDCVCGEEQPDLRVAHFIRCGTECWFLVNEGNAPIKTEMTLPTQEHLGWYDLWSGQSGQCAGYEQDGGRSIALDLDVRGSILLFACGQRESQALPVVNCPEHILCPEFNLEQEDADAIRKEYTVSLNAECDMVAEGVVIRVEAEEMAELYVNGVFAGVGFWPPQNFPISKLLHEGENQLRLVVTGSLANKYGREPVWYGVKQRSTQHDS